MDSNEIIIIIFKLFLVLFLVLLNGFFVAAEFAIVKVRDTQLEPYILRGSRRGLMARGLLSNLDASLSATQLGITLASLGLGWVGEPVFAALLEPVMQWMKIESVQARHTISFIVGFSAITFMHIVVGELAPKSLAIQKPVPTTLWVSYPLRWFYRASYPFIFVLNNTSLWLLRRFGIEPVSEGEMVHSEEELRLLFSSTHEHAKGSAFGRDLVLNALDLRRRIVREVMRPRGEIVGLDTEASIEECIAVAEHSRFSRFPLCEEGNPDRTLGVVHFKDLFALRHKAQRGIDLVSVARKIIYVPETAHLDRLLPRFLERKTHFAVVVDEFGGTVGVVTMENIIEELVGQIQDEFDQEKPLISKKAEGEWEIDGALPLHELSELVTEPLKLEGFTTVSGWVTNHLGGFPRAGNVIQVGRYDLTVEDMDGMRVSRLTLRERERSAPPARDQETD